MSIMTCKPLWKRFLAFQPELVCRTPEIWCHLRLFSLMLRQVHTSVTRDSIFHVLFPSVSRRKLSAVPWLQKENHLYQINQHCMGDLSRDIKMTHSACRRGAEWKIFGPDDEHQKAICIPVQFLLRHLSMESSDDCPLPCFVQDIPTFWPSSSLDLSSCGEYLLQNLWKVFYITLRKDIWERNFNTCLFPATLSPYWKRPWGFFSMQNQHLLSFSNSHLCVGVCSLSRLLMITAWPSLFLLIG